MPDKSNQEIKLAYCYARKDRTFFEKLQTQLKSLNYKYRLTHWSDREIVPGENWERAISRNLATADVILLLISPYFIASEYCYGKEMRHALERHRKGDCRVIPILLRPSQWKETPLRGIQLLPTDTKPITQWTRKDDAYYDIVKGIDNALKNLLLSRKTVNEWFTEALTLSKFKRYEESIEAYDQIIRLDPNNSTAYNNKGTALSQLERYEEAVAAYKQAIDLTVDEDPAYYYASLGFVLGKLKRYEEALEAYDHVSPHDSHYAECFVDQGEILSQLERYEEALEAFDQAISLDPEDTTAYNGRRIALSMLGKEKEARKFGYKG